MGRPPPTRSGQGGRRGPDPHEGERGDQGAPPVDVAPPREEGGQVPRAEADARPMSPALPVDVASGEEWRGDCLGLGQAAGDRGGRRATTDPVDPAAPARLAARDREGRRAAADPAAPTRLAAGDRGRRRAAMDPAAPRAWPPETEEGGAPPWIRPPPRAWPPETEEGGAPPRIRPPPRAWPSETEGESGVGAV
ncbi:uncharacterized protein [Miscanthus floridulus]|uniref:uncharacterized protein n=1 Tax=Miscanthus floridulus TaxID=154761 RepID=UPI0034594870